MPTSPVLNRQHQYANPTREQKAVMLLKLLLLPAVLLVALVRSMLYLEKRRWRRSLAEHGFKYIATSLDVRQLQYLLGTSQEVYESWARRHKMRARIDNLDNAMGAKLFWIGERRRGPEKNVVLLIHDDAFLFPIQDFTLSFWSDLQSQLQAKGKPLGIACLDYSLIPTAPFPTSLIQAVAAVKHLLSLDIKPENIHIAGGNLAIQLFSHMLHPLPGAPTIDFASSSSENKFGSLFLLSPWVDLAPSSTTVRKQRDSTDILNTRTLAYWGSHVLNSVLPQQQEEAKPYLEALKAPAGWFSGLGRTVKRVFVSAGGLECLGAEAVEFAERLQREALPDSSFLDPLPDSDEMSHSFIAPRPRNAFGASHPVETESLRMRPRIPTNTERQKRVEVRSWIQTNGVYINPYVDFIIPTEVTNREKIGWVVRGWFESVLQFDRSVIAASTARKVQNSNFNINSGYQ